MLLLGLLAILSLAGRCVQGLPAQELASRWYPECPFEMTRAGGEVTLVSHDRKSIHIKFLAKGAAACAYILQSSTGVGLEDEGGQVVVKTPRFDNKNGKMFPPNETHILKTIKQLLWDEVDADGREWIAIPWVDGMPIVETKKWQQMFPSMYNMGTNEEDYERCREFLRHIYSMVATRQKYYATEFGYDSADYNWMNFLFDDDLTKVEIIDWDRGQELNASEVSTVYTDWMEILEKLSDLPVDDVPNKPDKQGICRSEARMSGSNFRNRLYDFVNGF